MIIIITVAFTAIEVTIFSFCIFYATITTQSWTHDANSTTAWGVCGGGGGGGALASGMASAAGSSLASSSDDFRACELPKRLISTCRSRLPEWCLKVLGTP